MQQRKFNQILGFVCSIYIVLSRESDGTPVLTQCTGLKLYYCTGLSVILYCATVVRRTKCTKL